MRKFIPSRAAALAGKEFYQYLRMPSFYGIVVFFLVFCSAWLFYFQQYFSMNQATLRPYFIIFPIAYIFIIPVITMKSWAEERKTGTVETLLTMPFTEWDLALGKFFACFGVLAIAILLTVPLPLSLLGLGNFDAGVIFCEYLGALLLGASAVSLGLLLSSLSKSQAGSFLCCAVVLIFVTLIDSIIFMLNLPKWAYSFFGFFSLSRHFESFSKGLLDSRDLLFFIVSALLFLFLNTRVILFRKWK